MNRELRQPDCAIEQAVAAVGDWWSLLLLREVASGLHRFDRIQAELGVSSKVLTERLNALVDDRILERRRYLDRPPRFEYHLTDRGRGLVPVLVALQSWGARHLLGDGSLTATAVAGSPEATRVHGLVGRAVPVLHLPTYDGHLADPIDHLHAWTVVYCFPGAFAPGQSGHPSDWAGIAGASGCTLESATYRDLHQEFVDLAVTVCGISTQRPDQQAAFARHADLPFTLLSDVDLTFAAALRLPTFHAGGVERLKRLTLIVDQQRVIRHVQYPIERAEASVSETLQTVRSLTTARA